MADRAPSPGGRPRKRWLTVRDAYLLGYLPSMTVAAWLVPQASWERFCRRVGRLSNCVRRADRARVCADINGYLAGQPLAQSVDQLAAARATNLHLANLQVLRCYTDRGWRPRIELRGREHVDRALAGSKGAVLWVVPSIFNDLVTKIAFHQAGYRVSHLSRAGHGFSGSRFGARLLNPIVTTIEKRYLAERLVMDEGQSVSALKALVRRVRENGLVSIAVSGIGRRTFELPFFDGTIRVADGAPSLAERSGAALLPVSTARTVSGTFVTTIHPALELPQDIDRADRVPTLLRQSVGVLEWYVRNWPDQFSRPAG